MRFKKVNIILGFCLMVGLFLLTFLVKLADMESQEEEEEGEIYYDEGEELSEFELLRENVFNLTELEKFCLNISEQLNATKHRGFLHGFCIKTLLCFSGGGQA